MNKFTRGILVSIVGITMLVGCAQEEVEKPEPIRPVRAIKVGDVESFDQSFLPGRARASQEVDLSFRVAGPLITRPVFVGDEVKKDQVVATIDPRDYKVEVRNAEGQLAEAKAALVRAQGDFDRIMRIFKTDPGATSKSAVDKAREDRDRAKAAIKSLEATEQGALDRLDYTYLKSPFDGTVTATYVENFTSVRAKQPIVRILDSKRMKFDVDVPEKYISFIPSAKNIRVTFDAFPDTEIPAELFEIGAEASKTTRTYLVTLIMDQPENFKILAGMAGKVRGDAELPGGMETDQVIIPVTAVFSPDKGETSFIWVIDEQTKTVTKRKVTARRLMDSGIIVEEGLKSGEWIATAGVHFLEEGQQVKILQEQGG